MESELSLRSRHRSVQDQGKRPVCSAFAVTGAHEQARGSDASLSEESCLWSAKKLDPFPGEATAVRYGFEGVEADRQALAADWPYGKPKYLDGPPDTAAARGHWLGIAEWEQLGVIDLGTVRTLLERGEGVVLSIRFVPEDWYAAHPDGLIAAQPGATAAGGHAVAAVGVAAHTIAGENHPTIEVRNSWGPQWGDGGYGFIPEKYWMNYGKRAFRVVGGV
jgi:Papain family cysteine protease